MREREREKEKIMYSKENGKEQVVVVMAGAEYRKECLEGKKVHAVGICMQR